MTMTEHTHIHIQNTHGPADIERNGEERVTEIEMEREIEREETK